MKGGRGRGGLQLRYKSPARTSESPHLGGQGSSISDSPTKAKQEQKRVDKNAWNVQGEPSSDAPPPPPLIVLPMGKVPADRYQIGARTMQSSMSHLVHRYILLS